MEYIIAFGVILIFIGIVSWRWVEGIDYMQKNHPDYKGDDLFGEWDDNKAHTEGEF